MGAVVGPPAAQPPSSRWLAVEGLAYLVAAVIALLVAYAMALGIPIRIVVTLTWVMLLCLLIGGFAHRVGHGESLLTVVGWVTQQLDALKPPVRP